MAKIPLLNKNNLPTFMEEFIGAAAKTLDTFDLTDNDGWLSSIPFGKLAGFLVQKMVEIGNEQRALSHSVGFACSAAFSQAMARNALKPTIEKADYEKFEKALKILVKDKTTELGAFDLNNFWESPLVQEYVHLFDQLLLDAEVSENYRKRIKSFMQDYCRLSFLRLLRDQETVYGKVNRLLNSELYEALKEQYKLEIYRAYLKNQYTEITLNDDQGMTLDAIYQEPGFRIFEKSLEKGDYKKDNKAFIPAGEVDLSNNIHDFVDQWLRGKIKLEKLKAQESRLLLLYGYPGQGKTSFCKRLVYDLLGQYPADKEVFMVHLRNIANPHDLKAEILNTIREHLTRKYDLATKELERSILILDGLDELLMRNKLQSEDVETIFKNIRNEVKLNDELQVIVTSRFGYLNLERLPASVFLVVQLEEFDLDKQIRWLEKYLSFHDSWLTPEKLRNINGSGSHLKELVEQPILLHLVATLEEGLDKDVNRAKVYERLFDQITNPKKWKKEQISVLEDLTSEDLREALQEMAYEIWHSGEGYIHKSKIENLPGVLKIAGKLKDSAGQFQDVLKVMMVAFYFQEVVKDQDSLSLVDDPNHYAIEFLHKSLQEYLTAEFIWNHLLDRFLEKGNRRDKSYTLKEESKVLKLLQEIFGSQTMSIEISDYLVEVIENHADQQEKDMLAKRLQYFISYLFKKDFLFQYSSVEEDNPLKIGARVFYGYWTILKALTTEIYFLLETDDNGYSNRFAFLQILKNWSTQIGGKIDLRYLYLPSSKSVSAFFLKGDNKMFFSNISRRMIEPENLCGFDLVGSKLQGAELSGIYMNDINLLGSDLTDANLSHSFLMNANLAGTKLISTDLSYANLYGANFWGANLKDTDLSYANLNNVKNLHSSQICEARSIEGCIGLSKAEIEQFQKVMDQKHQKYK